MSSNQQVRQSELFAGENWDVIYKAFSQISFQAYDYDSIKAALVQQIQILAPESYNDWIQSSEFVMIIEIVAYLGQSLAFRVDLNARENFLDTAERRDSILKLAKMLSYNPKRNYPARGVLKLSKIRTTQEIRDSNGSNLANIDIIWNDPTNQDWFERFILVMNNTFASTNPFGLPVKQQLINGINSQLYQLNSAPFIPVADQFSASVSGQGTRFEIVNADFDQLGFFTERAPDPLNAKHFIYRNDGAGNGSPNTGFFAYFKQGNLQFQDFEFKYPQENRIIDINVNGINELDVWVEEINDAGLVIDTWTKVPSTENIAYNSVDRQVRNIYSVITRDNDQISIKFGDGRFGRSPTGLYRVWFRTSNGQRYQIRSNELENVQISIPYVRESGSVTQQYTLTMTFDLEYGINTRDVGSSVPRETSDQIKHRANQVFYTQDRMVNGEDYNIFPLQMGNTARKVKAINRTYSGQSRYIDVNDPTGRYQNTNFFGEDGVIYEENFNRSDFVSLPTILTSREIISSNIQPLMSQLDLRDFFYANYPRPEIDGNPTPTRWYQASGNDYTTTGQFESDVLLNNVYAPQLIGPGTPGNYPYLREAAMVKFSNPSNPNDYKWSSIVSVSGGGVSNQINVTGIGPVVLSDVIPQSWRVDLVIPAWRSTLSQAEISDIEDQLNNKVTFGLRYDYENARWVVVTAANIDIDSPFSLTHAGDSTNTNQDSSWLLLVEYLPAQGFWKFSSRNLRYVFESVSDARFYFVDNFSVVDVQRNLALRDYIKILKVNAKPSPSSTALGKPYLFNLLAPFVYEDGYVEPRRVQITFTDSNSDGIPDDPDIFDIIVDPNADESGSDIKTRYVFQKYDTSSGDYENWIPAPEVVAFDTITDITLLNLTVGQVGFVVDEQKFYQRQTDNSLLDVSADYRAFKGRGDIMFQWKHYVPDDQRIDPTFTNLIDMYVLTETYNQAVQTWLNSVSRGPFPLPPTNDDLRMQFSQLENSKMISDEIIWHSANFKLLFGAGAQEELRAQFKVVKVPGTTVTDNEIKQRVIDCINQYFNVDNFSFGENFYYTELAAYIHVQLSTVVASVVLVPNLETSKFGDLFVVRAEPNQLFVSTASVSDVLIVDTFTTGNIRIGN